MLKFDKDKFGAGVGGWVSQGYWGWRECRELENLKWRKCVSCGSGGCIHKDPSSSVTALQTQAEQSPTVERQAPLPSGLHSLILNLWHTQNTVGRCPSWETRETLIWNCWSCLTSAGVREGGVSWVLLNNRWVTSPLCWRGLKPWAVHSYFCSMNFNQTKWAVEWRKFFVKLYWKINIQT